MAIHSQRLRMAASRMRPFLRIVIGIVVFLVILAPSVLASAGSAASSVDRILLRSMLSSRQVNLRGSQREVVVMPSGVAHFMTKEVIRRKDGHSLARCVDPAEQRGQVKTDDGIWTRAYDPRRRTIELTRSLPRLTNESDARRLIRRIHANYAVYLRNQDWIAGRTCDVIEMVPRDPYGHGIKIWVDRATGVTLSRQESGRKNETLGLTFYTNVTFPKQVADGDLEFKFPARSKTQKISLSKVFREISPLRKIATFEIYIPVSMPAGFEFESCEMALLNGSPVACLRFSDGASMITICQSWLAEPVPNGYRPMACQSLARGETMVLSAYRRTSFMVVGPREKEGMLCIPKSFDNDREREILSRLSKQSRLPISKLISIRTGGIGLDHLAALVDIASRTGRKLESLMAMHRDGWSCRSIAERLKVDPQRLADRIREFQTR